MLNFQIAVFAVSAAILPVKPSFDRGHLAERVEHLFSSGAWRIQSPLRSQGKCVFRALYFHEAGQEERRLVRKALDRLIDLVVITAARSYGVLRFLGRGLGIDPQSHPRIASLIEAIQDTGERAEVFDREFADHIDPWNYAGNPIERERHQLAAQLLDSVRGEELFRRSLEIACAEGIFTELLAPRSESLLAVDFSAVALGRARTRRQWATHVEFGLWDLRRCPVPGHFDLIVVMDVLTLIRRPQRLRAVFEKLANALRPGDLMLAGDYREKRLFEDTWWGKRLLRGGKQVIDALATHPAFETVKRADTDTHVFALLRKT